MSPKKEDQQQQQYVELQNKTRCGYCRNPMVMSEPLTENNFVSTPYTWRGKPVVSLFCSSCLANEKRVSDPNIGINPETLEEVDIRMLAEVQPQPQPQHPQEIPTVPETEVPEEEVPEA